MTSTKRPRAAGASLLRLLGAAALALAFVGCDRGGAAGTPPATAPAARAAPTVASAVPSATDLLVGRGAADHLVGVANVGGVDEPATRGLPRIGDYQTFDWEKLADIRPDILVVFMSEDRMPLGLKQQA